jgi:hypothetical protein
MRLFKVAKKNTTHHWLAFAQSEKIFDLEKDTDGFSTAKVHLGVDKNTFITTSNEITLYKFLLRNYINRVRRFIFHIDSDTSVRFIKYCSSRATKKPAVKKMFEDKDLMIVNTYSNADGARDTIDNILKDSGVIIPYYYNLGRLSAVLSVLNRGEPGGTIENLVLVPKNVNHPYVSQIKNYFNDSTIDNPTNTQVSLLSDVTDEMIDSMSNLDTITVCFLNDIDYKTWDDLVPQFKFNGDLTIIEPTETYLLENTFKPLRFSNIKVLSSSVCINASCIEGLCNTIKYEQSAVALAKTARPLSTWPTFVETKCLTPALADAE